MAVSSNILEAQRYKHPLRIPRTLAPVILSNKYTRQILVYLQLKPLFTSSVIHSVINPKTGNQIYNFAGIAEFLKCSLSKAQKDIQTLRKLGFVRFDMQKNIHFCSYIYLKQKLTHSKVKNIKTLKYANDKNMFEILVASYCFENLTKQDYQRRKKIGYNYALESMCETSTVRYFKKKLNEQPGQRIKHFRGIETYFNDGEINNYIKTVANRMQKRIDKKYIELTDVSEKRYLSAYENNQFDKILSNPFTFLSSEKLAKEFKYSRSGVIRIMQRLESMKYLKVGRYHIKTNSTPAFFAAQHNDIQSEKEKQQRKDIKEGKLNRNLFTPDENTNRRRNFTNQKHFDKIQRRTRIKNRSNLYQTVIRLPNIYTIDGLATPYSKETQHDKAMEFKFISPGKRLTFQDWEAAS